MVRPYDNAGTHLLNLFNSVNQFANAASNVQQDWLVKDAKRKALNAQLQLDEDMSNKMLELQQNGNYENWPKEVNNLFTKIRSEMEKPGSVYNPGNNYTAQVFNEMIEKNYRSFSDKVAIQALARKQDDNRNDLVNNINKITSEYEDPQNCLDMIEEHISANLATNDINNQQADNLRRSAFEKVLSTEAERSYLLEYENDKDADAETIEEKAKKKNYRYSFAKNPEYADIFGKDNEKKAVENGINSAKRKVYDAQTKTYNSYLSQYEKLRTDILLNSDSGNSENYVNAVLGAVKNLSSEKNYALDTKRKIELENMFTGLLSSQSASGTASATKILQQAFKDKENFVNLILLGKQRTNDNGIRGFESFYIGREAYLKELNKAYVKAYGDANEKGYSQKYINDYLTNIKDFAQAWKKQLKIDNPAADKYIDELSKLPEKIIDNKAFNKIVKKDPAYAKELSTQVEAYLYDQLASMDMSTFNAETLTKSLNDFADRVIIDELSAVDWWTNWGDDYKEAKLLNATKNAEKDLVFTTVESDTNDRLPTNVQYIGGSKTEENLKNIQKVQMEQLKKDKNLNDLQFIGYEKSNDGHDADSTPVYKSGNTYYKYATMGDTVLLFTAKENKDGSFNWTEEPRMSGKNSSIYNTKKDGLSAQKEAENYYNNIIDKIRKDESFYNSFLNKIPEWKNARDANKYLSEDQKRKIVENFIKNNPEKAKQIEKDIRG